MGKERGAIRMLVIDAAADGSGVGGARDKRDVLKSFRCVRVKEARCSSPADREKILAIVRS